MEIKTKEDLFATISGISDKFEALQASIDALAKGEEKEDKEEKEEDKEEKQEEKQEEKEMSEDEIDELDKFLQG